MYNDKPLNCRECGQSFLFTAGEQEFFASKGFANEPTRCPDCRAQRKSQQGGYSSGGYGGGGYSGGYDRSERQMFSAICTQCGKEARVPFQPREDRPVYCSDCFATQRGESSSAGGRRNSW